MKPVHQRKAMSLRIDIEALLSMLARDGYLDHLHRSTLADAPGLRLTLPEDGRLLRAHIDSDGVHLHIDIESDSISDYFAMTHGLMNPRRVCVPLDRRDSGTLPATH